MNKAAARWGKAVAEVSAVAQAADAGFDYVAVTMEYIMASDDEQFTLQKKRFGESPLLPEVCLSVLPTGVAVTASDFNLYYWLDYLKRGLRRLADIGCGVVVWRDGGARLLPLEGDESAAKERCFQFIHLLCRLGEEHGVAVMVEPLSVAATNYLNTLNEVEDFIAHINKDNLHPAISWADATAATATTALCGDIKSANLAARVRHICAESLPTSTAATALQTAGCPITLLD